jgi:hypothetical protein
MLIELIEHRPEDWTYSEMRTAAKKMSELYEQLLAEASCPETEKHEGPKPVSHGPAKEWLVRLTSEQLQLIKRACEFTARVQAGQLEEVERWYANQAADNTPKQFRLPPPVTGTVGSSTARDVEFTARCERRHEFGRWLRRLEDEFGLRENHHTPIGQKLWYLYTQIRHDLAWDRCPEPHQRDWGVQYDKPIGLGGFDQPLKTWRADQPEPTAQEKP